MLGARTEVVLPLGSGRVNLESALASLGSRPRLLALDLSLEELRRNDGSWRVCGNAEALPLATRSADLIVSKHIFEHFPVLRRACGSCIASSRRGAGS